MIKPLQPPWRARKCNPPLVANATTFPPLRGGTTTRAYCRAIYEESGSRCFVLPPEQGAVRRSEPVSRIAFMPYDTESQSRNVLSSPLGEEGHEVAKGVQANWIHRGAPRPANPVRRHPAKSVCTRVRMIMILNVDVTAERRHYRGCQEFCVFRLTNRI